MSKKKIMVVEDESLVAKDIKTSLQKMGYTVPAVVATGTDAIKKAEEIKPDLILMDIVLREKMNGIDTAGYIRNLFNIPIIYLTAYADDKIIERAKITEPFGYIIKPFEVSELHSAIEMALYKHEMEKKLLESQKWFFAVLNSIGDAVIASDVNGFVEFINPVAENLTGWKNDEAKGKALENIFNIINEETGEKVESPVTAVLRNGTTVGLANHTILISRNGARLPIDDSGAPITDEKGNVAGVVLVFHDVSEKKKAFEEIKQSKKDWESTFDTISDVITIHDLDFNIIRANKTAMEVLGLKESGNSKGKCFKYFHGTDSPPVNCPTCQSLRTKKASSFECFEPYLGKNLEFRAIPRLDSNNNIVGLIHIARDITERKKIEEEIEKAKLAWETTFDNAKEFIVLIDKDLNIMRCNKSFATFVSKSFSDIVGHKYTEFIPYDIIQEESKEATNIEVKTDSGDWIYLSHCPVTADNGNFLHTIIIATDIGELKNSEEKFKQSEKELKIKVNDLEKFYKMAVGRELKMKELKEKITNLNEELSEYKQP